MVEIWKRNSLIAYFCIFPSGLEYNTPKRPVWSIKKRSREQLWFKDFFASQRLTIKWTTIWYLLRGGEGPGGEAEEHGRHRTICSIMGERTSGRGGKQSKNGGRRALAR